jgi:hypothetical protein
MGIWMAKVAGGFGRKNISTTLFFFVAKLFNQLILGALARTWGAERTSARLPIPTRACKA